MKNKILTNVSQWVDSFVFFLESINLENPDIPIWVGLEANILEKCIYYNTEQLTRKDSLNQVISISKNNNVLEIWDYSLINIKILKENNIENVKHVPLESPEWYINKLKTFQQESFEYDVGFCGYLSDRRENILNELKSKGVKINTILSWGDERDIELAKCKTILNIHYEDNTNIFESARCEPWLKLGIPVITEKSLDDDSRCIVSEYENLVQTTIDYLEKNNSKIKINQIKMSQPNYEFAKYDTICFDLQNMASKYNEEIEGNVYWFQEKKANLSYFSKDAKNVLEVGFNVGHSCLLYLLSNQTSKIQLFDLKNHNYSEPCFNYLNKLFPNRLSIIWGDSRDTIKNFNTDIKYDLIHIDGGHTEDVLRKDILNSKNFADDNTLVIINDTDTEVINKICSEYVDKNLLEQIPLKYYTSTHMIFKYKSTSIKSF